MRYSTILLALITGAAALVSILNDACAHPLIALASIATYLTTGLLLFSTTVGLRILEHIEE